VNAERLYSVLIRPRISEKAARIQAKHNQYVFEVATDATRGDVKEAVETLFKVKVDGVQVLNVKGKAKGFRGRPGQRSAWRKAYVTLADGQSIDFGAQP
jgi:large subunit ribosomal protein L23